MTMESLPPENSSDRALELGRHLAEDVDGLRLQGAAGATGGSGPCAVPAHAVRPSAGVSHHARCRQRTALLRLPPLNGEKFRPPPPPRPAAGLLGRRRVAVALDDRVAVGVLGRRGRAQPAGVDGGVEGVLADPLAHVTQPVGQVLGVRLAGAHGPEGHRLGVGHLEADVPVVLHARTGRDELADDDVLLEPEELVAAALDGRLGQHPRRLLEGGGREPALGGQRRLGDAHQLGAALGRRACPPRPASG